MVKGDNKGHRYEKKIVEILKNKKLMPAEVAGAGSGPGIDAFFLHQGKKYSIEVKNRANGAEFGQKRLIPEKKGKEWKWNWAKKDLEITKHYTSIGVLEHLNEKKIIPNKHRKDDDEITYQDVKEDQKKHMTDPFNSDLLKGKEFMCDFTREENKKDGKVYTRIQNEREVLNANPDTTKTRTDQVADSLNNRPQESMSGVTPRASNPTPQPVSEKEEEMEEEVPF